MKIFFNSFVLGAIFIFNCTYAMHEGSKKQTFDALVHAVKNNDRSKFIDVPKDILCMTTDNVRQNLLHIAAESESTTAEMLEFLLNRLVDCEVYTSDAFVLNPLLDINAGDANGSTPLHIVSSNCVKKSEKSSYGLDVHMDLAECPTVCCQKALLLIESGAFLNSLDNEGMTPLDRAVSRRAICLTNYLIQKKAIATGATIEDMVNINEIGLAKGLLRRLKRKETDRRIRHMPILHYAALIGCSSFVKYLLDTKEADAQALDKANRTALDYAMQNLHGQTIGILVDYMTDVNLQDVELNTPLHGAVKLLDVNLVRKLLVKKANPNLQNRSGKTPIVYALQQEISPDRDSIVRALIKYGAIGDITDCDGRSVQSYVQSGHDRMLINDLISSRKKRLADQQSPVQVKKVCLTTSNSPAPVGSTEEEPHQVSQLSEAQSNESSTNLPEPACLAAEQCFACCGADSAFVQKPFVPEDIQALIDSQTPLHKILLYMNGDKSSLKEVIELSKNRQYLNAQDLLGNTPLHCAAMYCGKEFKVMVLKLLLASGADATIANRYGLVARMCLCQDETQACQLLMDAEQLCRFSACQESSMAEDAAPQAKKVCLTPSSFLVSFEVNEDGSLESNQQPEALPDQSFTYLLEPACSAAGQCSVSCASASCFNQGPSAQGDMQALIDSQTPLHKILARKDFLSDDAAELAILASNISYINAQDLLGNTPLHYAVMHCIKPIKVFVLKVLLNKGASPILANRYNKIAREYLEQDESEACQLLAEAEKQKLKASGYVSESRAEKLKASVLRSQSFQGERSRSGFTEMLMQSSVPAHGQSTKDRRKLQKFLISSKERIVRQGIMKFPCYIHGEIKNGISPHELAELIRTIKDIDLNVADAQGNTPLHVAASCNRFDLVDVLLNAGVRQDIQNNSGETALSICQKYGYSFDLPYQKPS